MTRLTCQSMRGCIAVLLLATVAAAADPLPAGVVPLGSPRFQDFTIGGALAFSPDSRLLAAGGSNSPVCVWDAASGKLVRTHGPSGSVFNLQWRSNDRLAALTFFGHGSFLMNEWGDGPGLTDQQRQELRKAADAVPEGLRLGQLVLAEDGSTVAAERDTDKARRIEVFTFAPNTPSALAKPRRTVSVPPGYGHWLSRDGKVLFVHARPRGGQDRLFAFDVADPKGSNTPVWELGFTGERHYPFTILSADGKRVVIRFVDDSVEVWDGPAGKRIRELPRLDKSVLDGGGEWPGLALSPDGKRLVLIRRDASGEVGGRVIDVATGADIVTLAPGPLPRLSGNAVFSPDGKRVAITGYGAVRVWDAETGADASLAVGHRGPVRSIVATPDGKTVVTTGEDLTVRGWDPTTGREKWRTTFPRVPTIRFATADVIAIDSSWPDGVTPKPLLDPATGKTRPLPGAMAEGKRKKNDYGRETTTYDTLLALSPDGKTAVTLEPRLPAIRVWSWPTAELKWTILLELPDKQRVGGCHAASFTPDGKQFVALMLYTPVIPKQGSMRAPDHTPYLERWDPATARRQERTDLGAGTTPALVGNGSQLLVVRSGGGVADAVTGKEVAALGNAEGFPRAMRFGGGMALSPDGRTLAVATGWAGDGAVRLIELGTGNVRAKLPAGSRYGHTVAFLPDGRVATAGDTALVWPAAGSH